MAHLDELFNLDGSEKVGDGQSAATGAGQAGAGSLATRVPVAGRGLKTLKLGCIAPKTEGESPPTVVQLSREGMQTFAQQLTALQALSQAPGEITVAQLTDPPFSYLEGAAGTGKTYLARQIIQERQDAILMATTGIAAVNLGDAATINSILGYFDTQSLWESYASGWLSTRVRRLRRSGVRILVLDEVSMLPADQLTVLCQALDDVNLKKSYDQSLEEVEMVSDESLEMKLVLVGDFAQLPPVKAKFAFESPEWTRFQAHTFKLDQIRRQGDPRFIHALQAVRKGRAEEALGVLESRMVPTLDFAFSGTTIVATNAEVDRINALRHGQLTSPLLSWPTVRSGEQQKDWLRLIPEVVELKVGALVMVLANKAYPKDCVEDLPSGYFYVNGDLATVVARETNGIRVRLQRMGVEQVVTPMVSEWKEPTGKKKPAYTIRGAVTRMPLRLAYATTVHKSQGLSLDQVQVSLASWMFSKGGMTYVALSRCRTLEGLRIVGNPKMFLGKCAVEGKIREYL